MVGVLLRGALPLFVFGNAKHRATKHQVAKPAKNAINPWLHDTSSHPITESRQTVKKIFSEIVMFCEKKLRERKANSKLAEYIRNGKIVSGSNTETTAIASVEYIIKPVYPLITYSNSSKYSYPNSFKTWRLCFLSSSVLNFGMKGRRRMILSLCFA